MDWGQISMKKEQNKSVIHNRKVFCGFIWKRKNFISFVMWIVFVTIFGNMIGRFCINLRKCISITWALRNSYLCQIQRTEIIKIFIKESKMVNDCKLQLMHLMILFALAIVQLNISMTLLLLNQKYLQMKRTRLAVIIKKWEIRKKLLLP